LLDRERRYPAWPSPRRNFTGLYYAAMMNAHVPFESWLERDVAMTPDLDPRCSRSLRIPSGCHGPSWVFRARVPDSAVRES
jgi:hypothetical protein